LFYGEWEDVCDRKDHQMMVRVGPHTHDKAWKRKGAQPAIMGKREFRGYVFLAEEGIKTKKDFDGDFYRPLCRAFA